MWALNFAISVERIKSCENKDMVVKIVCVCVCLFGGGGGGEGTALSRTPQATSLHHTPSHFIFANNGLLDQEKFSLRLV